MIARIRGRHEFARLTRDGTRIQRSTLWCTWCPDLHSRSTRVAFAIGRAYGPAVRRNRLRRQLRAALAELDRHHPLPSGWLLIGARPGRHREQTFEELQREIGEMIARIRAAEAGPCNG